MSLVAQTLARSVFREDGNGVPHRIAVQFVRFFVDDAFEFGALDLDRGASLAVERLR